VTVDAHQHFLDPGAYDYPWLDESCAAIDRVFAPPDLAPLLRAERVDATVVVQTLHELGETELMLAETRTHDWIAGVVGWVDLVSPDVGEQLDRLRELPGGERLVGVRHLTHDEPDAAWLRRPDVQRGISAVGACGLVFDLLLRPREIPAAVAAVAALPSVRFIVDHIAKPPIRSGWQDETSQVWADGLRELAGYDNVACKLSGLVTEADRDAWNVEDLRPFAEHALSCFGHERLLFGSDWPVCELAAPYTRVVAATDELIAGLSPEEHRAILHDNAVRCYSLAAAGHHPN
jgi:L-fuconolactonase